MGQTATALVVSFGAVLCVAVVIIEIVRTIEARERDERRTGDGSRAIALAITFLTVVILGIAIFYFLVWDQPGARCNRGDIGACAVMSQ